MINLNKAVFLDRDGTINVEKNYLYKIEDFEFIEEVPKAIKLLNDKGYKIIVITNQAGIARGYYKEDDVDKLHQYIGDELRNHNAYIDGYYYCPHHPLHGIGDYKINCNCRKPKTGLLEMAIKDFNINANESWMIGDKITDIETGQVLNLRTILVTTGYGELEKNRGKPDYITENLYNAVKILLSTND